MHQVGYPGNLQVLVCEAKLTRNTEFLGYVAYASLHSLFRKMDPYVVLDFGGQIYKTLPHKSGAKTPQWNHVR
jgi:hypothetical protein